jgi:hypothetical protein
MIPMLPPIKKNLVESGDSNADETQRHKAGISPPRVGSDSIGVMPTNAFLQADGSIDFFSCFFDDKTYRHIVVETNQYTRQKQTTPLGLY